MPARPVNAHRPPPLCSECKRTVDKVVGTMEEWVELGANPREWWAQAWLSPEDARLWHDVALACKLAGYQPPWRPKVYRTLKAPQFHKADCQVGCACMCIPWAKQCCTCPLSQ